MSNCSDVCLDQDLGYYNEFFAEDTREAKKNHKCGECGRMIQRSEVYHRAVGKCEGDWFVAKTCPECAEIRTVLICGEYFYGCLWEDIQEHIYPEFLRVGPSECLAELPSKAARRKLDVHFRAWADVV